MFGWLVGGCLTLEGTSKLLGVVQSACPSVMYGI